MDVVYKYLLFSEIVADKFLYLNKIKMIIGCIFHGGKAVSKRHDHFSHSLFKMSKPKTKPTVFAPLGFENSFILNSLKNYPINGIKYS